MVDVYPQWLNLTRASEVVAGDFIQSETALPVRISDRQVMEIMATEWDVTIPFPPPDAVQSSRHRFASCQMSRRTQSGEMVLNDPDCIDKTKPSLDAIFAEASESGGAGGAYNGIILHDHASNGKGFLYAGTAIFLGLDTSGITGDTTLVALSGRVKYRLVKVTAEELIGLVQQ